MARGSESSGIGQRWTQRFLALGSGLGLAVSGLALAWSYPIGGTERCEACGVEREARLGGLIRYPQTTSHDAVGTLCPEHSWRRVGCWRTASGFDCHR